MSAPPYPPNDNSYKAPYPPSVSFFFAILEIIVKSCNERLCNVLSVVWVGVSGKMSHLRELQLGHLL